MFVRSGLASVVVLSSLVLVACSGGNNSSSTKHVKPTGGCVPSAAECYVAGPNGPGAECLAKYDNTNQPVWQERLSQIQVITPIALASTYMQHQVIDSGVSLNQPSCHENGTGAFTWLLEIDPSSNKLTTGGGAPIPTDPMKGSCFLSVPNTQNPALSVKPATLDITWNGDAFSVKDVNLVVPIFLTATDKTPAVLLPIHGGELSGTLSKDHNCIGHFNGAELSPANNCLPDTRSNPPQSSWTNGGKLTGYITIAEADQVTISQIGSSLCVVLAGNSYKGPTTKPTDISYCKTSDAWKNNGPPKGDWCSTTNAPADASCSDAYHLEAGFTAVGFKINGNCK